MLLKTKREGGKYLLLMFPCEGFQKYLLSTAGYRENMEIQGFAQCLLSGDKDYCFCASIPNTFLGQQ